MQQDVSTPQVSESDLENQFKRFLESQENNYQKFARLVDKLASRNPDKSQIIKKCQELKKRGEKSIRLLKENSQEPDASRRQTPRVAPATITPIVIEAKKVAEPPPSPSSPAHLAPIELPKPSPSNRQLQARFMEKWIDPQAQPKLPAASSLEKHLEGRTSSQNSLRHTFSKDLPSFQKSHTRANPPHQAPQRDFEVSPVKEVVSRGSLPHMQPAASNPPDTSQLVKSTETMKMGVHNLANSSSPVLRNLSAGSAEDGLCLRDSASSQILIRDEIVSRFRPEREEPLDPASREGLTRDPQEAPQADLLLETPASPRRSQGDSQSNRSIDCVDFSSPKGEALISPSSYEKEDPLPPSNDIQVSELPDLSGLEEKSPNASPIDFSKLTSEDKACAIADFILENLILESFTEELRLREKLSDCARRIVKTRAAKLTHEISRYLGKVFHLINESSDEQHAIHTRLNTPIVQSDEQRLLLASSLVPYDEQLCIGSIEYESILNIQLYIRLEEDLRDHEYLARGISPAEIEREHIFHKLLFDCLNEKLDYCRKYGLGGCPPRFFSNFRPAPEITPEKCASILEDSKKAVVEWSQEKAGLLMEAAKSGIEENLEVLEAAREEALARHLHAYVEELETRWEENHDEIIEVFLAAADQMFDQLIEEVALDLDSLYSRRRRLPTRK